MPKRKYTMAERASMKEVSRKRKGSPRIEKEALNVKFYDLYENDHEDDYEEFEEFEESSSSDFVPSREKAVTVRGGNDTDMGSWVLAAGVVLLAVAIFTM